MPTKRWPTVAQLRRVAHLSQDDQNRIAEISELTNTKQRFRFVRHLEEYFTLTEIVLIMRALEETHK